MPQDAFTLRLVAKELDTVLRGGRVNKIAQPGREEVSLLIYTGKGTLKLLLSANASACGAYFTEAERENPLFAPGFCMLLRKYLQSAELLSVTTPGFERVLLFRFRCVSDFSEKERILCAEIMGKYSNLLLLEDGVILGALKTNSLDENCKRLVFAGAKYTPPAPQDKVDPSDLAALQTLFSENPDRGADFLFKRVKGLAPCTAQEIVETFRGGDFATHVHNFIFSDDISPCVLERDGEPVDFVARGRGIPFDTLSAAQSYYYAKKGAKRAFDNGKRKLDAALRTAVKKAEKRLAALLDKKLSCADMEQDRIKGELLTANLYALSRGMKTCELLNFYDENCNTLSISLDAQKSPSENAQAYFKKYRKEKRTLEALAPQVETTEAELEYLRSLTAALSVADSADDLASIEAELVAAGLLPEPKEKIKKQKPEIPYRLYEVAGFRICAGRNNLQNDRLLRQSAPDDIWLHAQKYHSCHVVIKADGRAIPDNVLQFSANVCAKYSDGGGDKIPVDYCLVKFVKKPPKSKAGFVTYSNFKTLLGDPSGV